jgi:HAD superfamily hydrolase (TIGR01459 family)
MVTTTRQESVVLTSWAMATSRSAFTIHPSFAGLIPLYDGFILDQFGVLHNGNHALEGAVELIEHLANEKKKLIILSNTSQPSSAVLEKLPNFGFKSEHMVGAVTSGEEASHFIRETFGDNPRKALFWTWKEHSPGSQQFLEQCGSNISLANCVDEADFIIAHGSQVWRKSDGSVSSLGSFMVDESFAELDPLLKECALRDIPMVCANPDFVVHLAGGEIAHMPGKIVRRYQNFGATNIYSFGKPHVPHFEACLRDLGLSPDRVAHVGDSLHHDVAGANASGVDSIFVAGGVHSAELGPVGCLPSEFALQQLFDKEGHVPTHVVPMFRL